MMKGASDAVHIFGNDLEVRECYVVDSTNKAGFVGQTYFTGCNGENVTCSLDFPLISRIGCISLLHGAPRL